MRQQVVEVLLLLVGSKPDLVGGFPGPQAVPRALRRALDGPGRRVGLNEAQVGVEFPVVVHGHVQQRPETLFAFGVGRQ